MLFCTWSLSGRKHYSAELRGSYSAGFETSAFVACDHPARISAWWISFAPGSTTPALDSIHHELEASGGERRARLYIEGHGTVSAAGQHGHLGEYSRRVTVDSVRRIAAWSEASCARE